MQAARFILWDEMICNDRALYEAAHRSLNGFDCKVLLCTGDFRQLLPVVTNANGEEIEFQIMTLTINMRLKAMELKLAAQLQSPHVDREAAAHARRELNSQKAYGKLIMEVGEARNSHMDKDILNENSEDSSQLIRFQSIPYLLNDDPQKVLDFLYPGGLDPHKVSRSCV